MSNSRLVNFDKSESPGATIGFIFHANDEELEEVQSKSDSPTDKSTEKTDNSTAKSLEGAKDETPPDVVKDPKSLLGKRSISVDSAYESPFSNPIETLKKLNVLKEKITKTVEEKILERKAEKSNLNKSSSSKLIQSKENSSISDSEDTSESSKKSEQEKDGENQLLEKTDDNLESQSVTGTKVSEIDLKEKDSELRNRKSNTIFPDIINLTDIKIAVAKANTDTGSDDLSFSEDIESGIEAHENLEATEEESIDFFDGETLGSGGGSGGSTNPPSGGGHIMFNVIRAFYSIMLPQSSAVIFFLGFTLYFFLPLSDFIRGFLLSGLLVLFWGLIKNYFEIEVTPPQQGSFVVPDYKAMPPLKVPECKPVKGIWFNEYEGELYDPDYYSVTQTVPAYLELEENTLKISRPKGKIRRRATYDEPEYKFQIISHRIYDISGCNVYLMPEGLTRKRLFSKKYPIVIFLKPNSLLSEKKHGKDVDDKELHDSEPTENTAMGCEPHKHKTSLYLFARCDRQKEEWYRRLLSATRIPIPSDHPKDEKRPETPDGKEKESDKPSTPVDDSSPGKDPGTPFENVFFDDEVACLDEYYRYMAKFVNPEIAIVHHEVKIHHPPTLLLKKPKPKKKDSQNRENEVNPMKIHINPIIKKPKSSKTSVNLDVAEGKEHFHDNPTGCQVQWFSAFVNRILFDVFRSPYWLEKIQNKVQRKLNSIRLPYYIEDIEVIEMDLGKTGPVFHRVSDPYMDDRGLWFDMDVTFDGFIKLTIQTHLNLIKLQKGIEENEALLAEKQKKGKKKKESKDSVLVKDSNAKHKNTLKHSTETEDETCIKPCILKTENETQHSQDADNDPESCTCKTLIHEVTKLVEIAVEESLSEKKAKTSLESPECPCPKRDTHRSPIYDSELEDSAESSDEEDEEEPHPPPPQPTTEEHPTETLPKRYPKNRRSSKKIFKVFENVAQSKYFRSMAQSKYIQKAIAGVSAAKLGLTLEIKGCSGVLAINIPPPPSDRFWYGFRKMPTLVFSANPKIGEKALKFVHIKNYLQKKILHELKAKLVQPNMICVVCSPLVRDQYSPVFFNIPRFPNAFGKKVMVTPNMIDFILPTSPPVRSSSSLQIEDPELQQEVTLSE